ncbi:alpha/beta-hydrolase [Lichtheimia hyalospora FSU 10163]|nr:alpha/beta-hydrolase [Lichtheimia hyalospora FSU 10163]
MKRLGTAIRKVPPGVAIKILRRGFVLPAPAARLLFKDILRPEGWHRKWIHKVKNSKGWWGCWIGENVHKLDRAAMMERVAQADIVFFHVHGGGFRIGKCNMFMDTYIHWLQYLKEHYNINAVIMSAEHRLSPEYKYPSATEDVVHAYEHLVNTLKVDPSKIIAIGGSTGAALILEMLFITHDPTMFEVVTDNGQQAADLPDLPRPAGAVLSSPLVTDQTTSDSWRENTKYDYISQFTAKRIIDDYFEEPAADTPPDTNRLLGIAELQTGYRAFLPECLMYVGNKETLRDDALDFGSKAEQDGVPWQTFVGENEVHDWFVVREVVRDKKMLQRADALFGDFCYRMVIEPRRNTQQLNSMLHAVPEEDEKTSIAPSSSSSSYATNDDEEFHDSLDDNRASSTSTTVSSLPSSKRKTSLTIYV